MQAKADTNFEVNDYILHGGSGICLIEDICTPKAHRMDPNKTYYRLLPLYEKGSVIYTPTDNAASIVRKVMTRDEAEALIDQIPYLETIWIDDEKTREGKYKEALNTNSCTEWIRVIKTLYLRNERRKEEGKRTVQTDEKYLQLTENLLYGELAVALDMPREEVQQYITDRVEAAAAQEEQCS